MGKLFRDDEAGAVVELLLSRFGVHLQGECLRVDGRSEPDFVEIEAFLEKADGSFCYQMSVRAPLGKDLSREAGKSLALDFLGYILDQYFGSDRELLLPLDYQTYPFGDHHVQARGDLTNPRLDAAADRIIERGVPLDPDDPAPGL
ncbi:MAG: hypothetical protein ISR64_11100 [Deltaproteobacteria bacterium]|nr:hypothetical protein [Deltaproteobacteria bacterium]